MPRYHRLLPGSLTTPPSCAAAGELRALVETLVEKVETLDNSRASDVQAMGQRMEAMDQHMQSMDQRMQSIAIDQRMHSMDQRMQSMDQHMQSMVMDRPTQSMDQRMQSMDRRMQSIEGAVERLERLVTTMVERGAALGPQHHAAPPTAPNGGAWPRDVARAADYPRLSSPTTTPGRGSAEPLSSEAEDADADVCPAAPRGYRRTDPDASTIPGPQRPSRASVSPTRSWSARRSLSESGRPAATRATLSPTRAMGPTMSSALKARERSPSPGRAAPAVSSPEKRPVRGVKTTTVRYGGDPGAVGVRRPSPSDL